MRDLMVFGMVCMLLPMALRHGYAAYLLWGWTAQLVPTIYVYGFMESFRFNFVFAIIAIGMLLLGRVSDKGTYKPTPTMVLLIAFFAHMSVCAALAFEPNPINYTIWENFAKSFTFVMLMPLFVSGRLRLHGMLLMIALGLGFHGTVEGLKVIASGGGHHPEGLLANILSDNNHFAVGMAVSLPIHYYLYQYSEKKLARLGFLTALILTAVTILGTNSRGGFLSMAVVGLWMVMTSRYKFRGLFWVAVAAAAIYNFAPASWVERVDTIQTAGSDGSFMGRVAAWKVSSAIAIGNPVFGGGLHAVQQWWIVQIYENAPSLLGMIEVPPLLYAAAAHSIYFEVLGDTGFVGLFLFLGLLINGLATRVQVVRLTRRHGTQMLWARDMADLLAVALAAYMVGGAAVSLAYFCLLYTSPSPRD